MKQIWGTLAALTGALMIAAPVLADVKAGVDAWQQGDYARAIAQWRPLAQAGDADAQFNMGQAYKLGRGVQSDMSTAIEWYRKAAAQGHTRAEDNLGLLMFQQGDRAGAMPYLQKAATRGEARAQYIVGTALFNGDLVSKDWVRAYALMTRASSAGLSQATTSLAQMDKYIPSADRQKGLALASEMESQQQAGQLAFAPSVSTPRAVEPSPRPTSGPLRTSDLPSSATARPAPAPIAPKPALAQAAAPKPAPKPAAPRPAASVPAPSAGGWRVQLGAFSEDGRARSLWSSLSGKVSGLSAYQPYYVKGGPVTRLQAGPLASNADAQRLCGRLKAAGADCIPKKM
ncbi:SPOR domain-containing protein [Sphingobium aromaticiconvertens]|uniref:SPOR domain-containing protein n=1 Tax=Sphingobium aromaticiconvertens TaxID=365341 RepID=UPI0030192EA4